MNRKNAKRNSHLTHQKFKSHSNYRDELNYRLNAENSRLVIKDDSFYAHEKDFN